MRDMNPFVGYIRLTDAEGNVIESYEVTPEDFDTGGHLSSLIVTDIEREFHKLAANAEPLRVARERESCTCGGKTPDPLDTPPDGHTEGCPLYGY